MKAVLTIGKTMNKKSAIISSLVLALGLISSPLNAQVASVPDLSGVWDGGFGARPVNGET
ncbi:MAG: hypothetical protein HOG51_08280, partial [Gammaproteobacteria bacterium]|nr:hypothetical protein [Gammaproteobacteria bacterium]